VSRVNFSADREGGTIVLAVASAASGERMTLSLPVAATGTLAAVLRQLSDPDEDDFSTEFSTKGTLDR
jgi:hypothetical protein